jgi:hypothetical protein
MGVKVRRIDDMRLSARISLIYLAGSAQDAHVISPKNVTASAMSLCVGTAILVAGCVVDPDDREVPWTTGFGGDFGNDTDTSGDGDGDGDPDPTGDGDPDPTTGDGDGDPDPTGDGDPDPTTGDGDGDCDGTSPYMGGWDVGCCQDQVVSGAWSPGQINVGTVTPDWTFNDQYGDAVRLYDFCHDAIYFEYVALW